MCTSISITDPIALFGRNLDLEYSFGEQVVITPRQYAFSFKRRPSIRQHFAMIGMANAAENFPLYAEAVNEKGLYMAGLNFPDNAFYATDVPQDKEAIAPYELIPLLLGTCETLSQARQLLKRIQLAAIPFSQGYPLAPLHWHIADATGSLVVEPMKDGIKVYENPVGVLTNNPPFSFHLMNLNNYQALTPHSPENRFSSSLDLTIYGQGMGAIGLPGDASPMSRFVKASFLKENSSFEKDALEAVSQFFHILDAVAMVRGSVVTREGKNDITLYSCCMDAAQGIYYYKTYENSQITAVHLFQEQLDSTDLKIFPLVLKQQVCYVNKSGSRASHGN